jgi:hypothetical protein
MRFWGLGWGLIYVAALYFVALVLVQYTGDKSLWVLWIISATAATVSALAVSAHSISPAGFGKSVVQAVHYLNLSYAIVFTVLGLLALLSQSPR